MKGGKNQYWKKKKKKISKKPNKFSFLILKWGDTEK